MENLLIVNKNRPTLISNIQNDLLISGSIFIKLYRILEERG